MKKKTRQRLQQGFDAPYLQDLARRSVRLDNEELIRTLDTCMSTLNRYALEYSRTKDVDYLGEIQLTAQSVYVVAAELDARRGNRPAVAPARQTKVRSRRPY